MAEAGRPTHSFNLGIDAMTSPEDAFVLEEVLAKRHRPFNLLISECYPIQTEYSRKSLNGTLRHVYWHDLKRLTTVIRSLCERNLEEKKKLLRGIKSYKQQWGAIGSQVPLYFSNAVHVGRGLECLESTLTPRVALSTQPLGPSGDGYVPAAEVPIDDAEWLQIQKEVLDWKKKAIKSTFNTPESQRLIQEKEKMVHAQGGTLVLFIAPSTGGHFLPSPQFPLTSPVFDFADPSRYPEFFERPNRLNVGHLSRQGAELFTRYLVEQLVAFQRANEQSVR
jgi:hypothetical protein